jgi:3-phosphoglycerate kinase
MLKTIHNLNLKNKKVFLRVGFDVPLGDDEKINGKEDWRIKASLPTIKYLLKENCRIILATHLGRPKGKTVKKLSVKPIQKKLSEILNLPIIMASDCIGSQVEKTASEMQSGEILLLENLRFYQEEEKNDLDFAKKLANLAEIYINDAFSVCHRQHASVYAITKFLPSYAGILIEKEVSILSEAINNPKRPATIIIGGAKAKTKVPVIKYLLDKFDNILIGGIVANVILKAKGIDIGNSLLSDIDLNEAKKISFKDNKLHIPVDAVACNDKNKIILSAIGKIGNNKILDIGSETAEMYSKIISDSKTIIWNGPMGKFEKEEYSKGTKKIAEAVAESNAYKIVGGGDTIFALSQFGLIDKMDFVSTGGGSMLQFLSGKKLPGLEALEN